MFCSRFKRGYSPGLLDLDLGRSVGSGTASSPPDESRSGVSASICCSVSAGIGLHIRVQGRFCYHLRPVSDNQPRFNAGNAKPSNHTDPNPSLWHGYCSRSRKSMYHAAPSHSNSASPEPSMSATLIFRSIQITLQSGAVAPICGLWTQKDSADLPEKT